MCSVGRKAHAVERLRCVHCRNPIKPHQQVAGPESGDRTFHEDCWEQARNAGPTSETRQRDYEQQIAENGLSALLSPYVCVLPRQRETNSSVWA
jgi:hypothetical protein